MFLPLSNLFERTLMVAAVVMAALPVAALVAGGFSA